MSTEDADSPQACPRLMLSLCIVVCLCAFTVDISITAFAEVSREFAIASGKTHLIITAFMLGQALAQIPLGFLSERIGRVKSLYLGLLIFVVGGVIASFSIELNTLLLGRFIQGVGGACGPVVARAIVRDSSEGAALGRMMALLITALGLSTILAPIIGSLLLTLLPWWSVFACSLVLGLVCLLLVYCYVPESRPRTFEGSSFKHHLREFWQHRPAVIGTLLLALLFCGYIAYVSSFSTIAADQFGVPGQQVGWIFALFISTYLIGSALSQRLMGIGGEYRCVDLGCQALMLSVVLCLSVLLLEGSSLVLLSIAALSFLFAMGLLFGGLSVIVLRGLPHIAGSASGIMGTAQILAGSFGSALSATFYRGNADSTLWIISLSSLLLLSLYGFSRSGLIAAEGADL